MKLSVNDYNRMSISEMNTLIQEVTAERDKRIKQERERRAILADEYEKKIRDIIGAAQSHGLAIYIDDKFVSEDRDAVSVYPE